MSDTLVVVKAKIKELAMLEGKALNVAADVAEALDKKVKKLIEEGCLRAKENGRNTLMAKDV
jgi:histone H3/H4